MDAAKYCVPAHCPCDRNTTEHTNHTKLMILVDKANSTRTMVAHTTVHGQNNDGMATTRIVENMVEPWITLYIGASHLSSELSVTHPTMVMTRALKKITWEDMMVGNG